MTHLYFRCNGGHYFRAARACPFDGWSSDGIEHAIAIFEQLRAAGAPTIDALRRSGVSPALIARTLVIDFGNDASAFDALVPERYIHAGREVLAHEVGEDLY